MSDASPSRDRLPPLDALRAFDAAARHMSFAKAAEELFVTPAALSWRIKQLETHLGTPLFRRLNRAVALTEAGRALAPGVAEGLAAFRAAQRAVGRLSDSRALAVTAGPGFTAKWLAPRLFRFAEAHPEIELRFIASLRTMDFSRDEVDAAVRFGPLARAAEEGPGLYSRTLSSDWVTPLCTPARAAALTSPEDLARVPLLHDDSLAHLERSPDWPAWFAAAGAPGAAGLRGPRFSNTDHAIDAAVDGAGVVLGRLLLAERELTAGRLAAPFPLVLPVEAAYRFVCPAGAEATPRTGAFLAWMVAEMTASLAALAPFLPPDAGDAPTSNAADAEQTGDLPKGSLAGNAR